MKRKLLIILAALFISCAIGIFYLNKVILPQKIKILIIHNLQEYTRKKVTLQSLRFSIFKGGF